MNYDASLPIDRLISFITERESIRLRRLRGDPAPWTRCPILQTYKFTNVRRMDDRVSQWFLKNWYKPNHGHKNMVLAATLARQFNNPEAMEEIGFPDRWNPARVERILEKRAAAGLKNFSGAYMITGTLGGTKVHQVVRKVADPIYRARLKPNTESMQATWTSLVPFAGFSSFMAGQVTADLRWAVAGEWRDRYNWAPAGPGSKRGMNRLHGRPLMAPLPQGRFLEELRDLMTVLKRELPKTIHSRLEAIDFQNCLCEFDKYERTLWGQGKPKQLYRNGKG